MNFNVSLSDKVSRRYNESVVEGSFNFSGSHEKFSLALSYWSRGQYLESWNCSINAGLKIGQHTAIITSMRDPQNANFIPVWIFYHGGLECFVQNKILFLQDYGGEFNSSSVNSYIGQRETHNEDGVRISEWVVPLQEVLAGFDALI